MPRVTRRHYAEQLNWWAASGWALEIEEDPSGGLLLSTVKKGGARRWGARAEASELYEPTQVRLFLAIALYLHLHPRKAQASYAATGLFCSDKELTAFISQQRRKVSQTRYLGIVK
jgi:hypothetical protein